MLFSFGKPANSVEKACPLIVGVWWIAFVILLILGVSEFRGNDLAEHAKVTEATITGFRPEIHDSVVVEFVVSGTTYSRLISGTSMGGDRRLGQKITIYDTRDPRNFSIGDPKPSLEAVGIEAVSIIVCGVLLTIFIVFYTAARTKNLNLPPILGKGH